MFRCNQCPKKFEDHSSIRRHLSIKHFTYSPYLCNICIKTEQFHVTATEDDMIEHFETVHPGTKPSITLSRDKVIEDKIKAVIEECRLPASQSISHNFKNDLHQNFNSPSDQSPFRATVTEIGPISSHMTQEQTNGETTEIAAENDIEIVYESAPQKVKDEVTTPNDISLGLKNALRRTYDTLCDETTVDTSAKEVECFSSEIKHELSNNEATGNITADENNDSNNKMIEKVTVQRESSINLLEKTSELCTKNLGRESLTTESNSCANSVTSEVRDAPIFASPELQSLPEIPIISNDTQSQAQMKSIGVSNETFFQIDEENIPNDSTSNGQSTAMQLPSVGENAFSDEQNTEEEFNENVAIVPAIETRQPSSSNESGANLIQRKRILSMNDRHSRTKLSSKWSNPKKTNDTEKLHKCDHCSHASAKKGHVVRHMRTHTGEKPFKCDHCSYACARKSDLNVHVRTHTGEKPFKCSHCTFACAQKGHLNIHIRTHTGEKPYKCDVCPYACTQTGALRVHMRTHTGEKPYKCSECDFAGSTSSQLCYHIRRHHSKKTE